ncbi:hypothetical protein CROQUDRAFT_537760 [Cronartium quercuum f. sp. fusiforme G11]|uniref:Uncharacterized protein n=1 Tax=Cronartium quercuum f. sp. fusiforme G11 TaxID=708437 RepID=A0A9P6NQ54_9BASI|nr:hypothetical protein CROQUDRAFT_537760 [Cronartium quercuum f. sp. fusiforme G11]
MHYKRFFLKKKNVPPERFFFFFIPAGHYSIPSSQAHTRGWASPGRPKPLPQAFKASALKPWPLGALQAAPEGLHLKQVDSLHDFGHEGEVNTNNFVSCF